MSEMKPSEQPELRQSLLGPQKNVVDFESDQELVQEKILKQLFPELVRRDLNRKTFFDKSALDFTFLVLYFFLSLSRIKSSNDQILK